MELQDDGIQHCQCPVAHFCLKHNVYFQHNADVCNHLGNATDIGTTYVNFLGNRRAPGRGTRGFEAERPVASYIANMLPPIARKARPADSIPAKHLHTAFNKVRHHVTAVKWTPEGRRLLTGSTSGEFTLWNGTGFNFETIMQAHDNAIQCVEYSHNDEFLISGDVDGIVKYWQTNFNNIQEIHAHQDKIRDMSFAPTDTKFATASDDQTVKIFDFNTGVEQTTLTGHGWDVKSVDWHPTKGLLVSSGKDHQVKLWDPRNGRALTSLMGHKNTVHMVRWEPSNGVLLASCARDSVRVFDIRMMRDVFLLKGHEKDVNSLVWHPFHSSLLTTGGSSGGMHHYLLDEQNNAQHGAPSTLSPYDSKNPTEAPAQSIWPAHVLQAAHDWSIWSMDWHPMGHILASGSNDKATRFWTRPRPGEDSYMKDKYHIGQDEAEKQGTFNKKTACEEEEAEEDDDEDAIDDQTQQSSLPGLISRSKLPGLGAAAVPAFAPPFPGHGPQPVQAPSFMPPAAPSPEELAALYQRFGGQLPPPGQFPPPLASFQPQGMPLGFAPPQGYPPSFGDGLPGMGQPPAPPSRDGGVRKRGPLPDQAEALKQEMRAGRYTKAR